MAKKQKSDSSHKKDLRAVLWGLAAIYLGALAVFTFSYAFADVDPAIFDALLAVSAVFVYGFSGWLVRKMAHHKSWHLVVLPTCVVVVLGMLLQTDRELSLFEGLSVDWLGLPFLLTGFIGELWQALGLQWNVLSWVLYFALVLLPSLGGNWVATHIKLKWE